MNVSKCIRTLHDLPNQNSNQQRPSPSADLPPSVLTEQEKKHSAALMRVNHTGEVCAQALYLGQSLTARSSSIREGLNQAAQEESDHLYWCQHRIHELDGHTSYLNPLWFTGSLLIGTVAGLIGDKWSLGFLAQTEHQVSEHLGNHLKVLPKNDLQSISIVAQMQLEEASHEQNAIKHGAATLPIAVTWGMQCLAKVMTSVTYYV